MKTLRPNKQGLYESEDGFLGVALGNYYGSVGDKFKITLEGGNVLHVIKADTKADKDTINKCSHKTDGSSIEFVIDQQKAYNYYGGSNGLPLNGNFNNHDDYKGNIVKVEKYVGK